MTDLERLVEELLRQKPEIDRASLSKMIDEKKRKVGAGYLTDQGAIFLVASDLGVTLDKAAKQDLHIKDLYIGASDVTIQGRILAIYLLKKYTRKDGSNGSYRRLVIFDSDSVLPVTLWDGKAEQFDSTSMSVGRVIRVLGGYVRGGLNGEPILHIGEKGEIQPVEDHTVSLPGLDEIVKSPSSIKTTQRYLCLEGIVKFIPRSSQFTGRDGTPRRVIQFHVTGSTGAGARIALWDGDESILSLQANSKIRILNVRSKVLTHGEVEFHGDEGTKIILVSPPPAPLAKRVDESGEFRLLSYGPQKTSKDGEPFLNALVLDVASEHKRLVAKGPASQKLSEIEPLNLFNCNYRRLDDKSIICDKADDISPFTGEDKPVKADAFIEKVKNIKAQTPPSIFEVIALSRTTVDDVPMKDGSLIKKAELLVGDETGEVKVVAWRDLADTLSGVVPGQRLRLGFVEPQIGRDGAANLQVRAYSQIHRH